MIARRLHSHGFTIVELVIVIVVIGILAAISIVSYAAVTQNAKVKSMEGDLQTAITDLNTYRSEEGRYPDDLATLQLTPSDGVSYQYTYDSANDAYCITASISSASIYAQSGSRKVEDGGCPGHGLNGAGPITNLVINPNATTVTGYSAAGASGTRSVMSSDGYENTSYLRRTFTATGSGGQYFGTGSYLDGLQGGKTYTASVWVRASKPVSMRLNIEWKSDSAKLANGYGPVVTVSTEWLRLSSTGVAPGGTTRATLTAYLSGSTWDAGDYQDIDAVMMTEGSELYTFADGSSPKWLWQGTANASRSYGPGIVE